MRVSILAAALLCGATIAQTNTVLGAPLNDPLFPGGSNKLDLQAILSAATSQTVNGILGCVRDRDGNYFVSARSPVLATGNNHKLYELDKTGKYVAQYDTLPYGTTVWGLRDLAYDAANHLIYGGCENAASGNKVLCFDVATRKFDPAKAWTAAIGSTTIRALAYNPKGDNGKGSMWTGDFGAALYEFRKDGTVIQALAVNQIQKKGSGAIYGAAYDIVSDKIWWFSQTGSSRTTGGGYQVVGIEMTSGSPAVATGNMFFGDQTIAGTPPGGIAGGIEFSMKNGRPTLICTHQANSDGIAEIYGWFNHSVGCDGPLTMVDEVPYTGNASWGLQLTASKASGGSAALFVSSGEMSIGPLPSPPFGANCYLLFGAIAPHVYFQVGPTVPVAGGKALFNAPIPTGLGGLEVRLQSVSIGGGSLYLSDLGKTLIYN